MGYKPDYMSTPAADPKNKHMCVKYKKNTCNVKFSTF